MDKLARILNQIRRFIDSDEVEAREVWSLSGRILNVKDLVVGGKFFLEGILKANSVYTEKKDGTKMVAVEPELKRELWCNLAWT